MKRVAIPSLSVGRKLAKANLRRNGAVPRSGSLLSPAAIIFLVLAAPAMAMEPLTEQEMGAVTGQEGVLVSLEYYYNSDPVSGTNLGGPGSSCNAPGQLGDLGVIDDCRFAMQIENREQEWLVYKNGYASLVVNQLSLDASFLSEAGGSALAYDGFFDEAKFKNVAGDCLLEGPCTQANIRQTPALRTHFPGTGGSYDPNTHESTGYNDARFGMYFEGLAIEYNTGSQEGWELNNQGSFMGAKIADNNGHQAGISFGGDFYMYGF